MMAQQRALEDADASTGSAAAGRSNVSVGGGSGEGGATLAGLADGMQRPKDAGLSQLSLLAVEQYRAGLLAPRDDMDSAVGTASTHAKERQRERETLCSIRTGRDAQSGARTGFSALTLAAVREAKSLKH